MNKFFIWATNACIERILDCQKIQDYFLSNKWQAVKNIAKADLIIISTCSLTKDEDESSADYIQFCLRNKSNKARVIIAGCMPIVSPEKFRKLGDFTTISPTNLEALDDIIKSNVKFREVNEPNNVIASRFHKMSFKQLLTARSWVEKFFLKDKPGSDSHKPLWDSVRSGFQYFGLLKSYINPLLVGKRNNFHYLRISNGCMGACNYCAKRFATGNLKSKSSENIINEFLEGIKSGKKYFFLVTEDSGCYGLDCQMTIVDLLKQLFEAGEDYDFKLAISNFNARWLIRYYQELDDILIKNQTKIYYLQIPIQSASNKVLKLMNRMYDIDAVQGCLLDLRQKAPDIALTTDIIAGFPGEADNDFEQTKEFLKKLEFEHVDVFGFQDRRNTVANKMKDKVSQDIIERRVFELVRVQNSKRNLANVFKKAFELVNDF